MTHILLNECHTAPMTMTLPGVWGTYSVDVAAVAVDVAAACWLLLLGIAAAAVAVSAAAGAGAAVAAVVRGLNCYCQSHVLM